MTEMKDRYQFKKEVSLFEEEEEKPVNFIIEEANNMYKLARDFIETNQPIYYDDNGIWWAWDFEVKCYKMIDEIKLFNHIKKSTYIPIWSSRIKGDLLTAFKMVAREKEPKKVENSWIQFKNIVVDLETGNRFKATPEYFFTTPIPHDLGLDSKTDKFDKLFEEWVGDKKQILYEIIAYSLYRSYPLERIFCLLGSGANGKSCFLNILRNVIGEDNVCSTKLHKLAESRFETAKLRNKLACIMGETNFTNLNETDTIKSLVSGKDPISIEYKNKNGFVEYINFAKLIIATNNLPETNDKTLGWGRRWLIIDFNNTFSEKRDILLEIEESDYERLLNKCVSVLMDVLRDREFTGEGTMQERANIYEEKSNPLEKFLKEHTIEDLDGSIWKWEFEKRLGEWCVDNHFRQISDMAIGKKMKQLGIYQERKTAGIYSEGKFWRAWTGIRWK